MQLTRVIVAPSLQTGLHIATDSHDSSPLPCRLAYNFMELIEAHAVDSYGQFVDENEALLKSLPPPRAAKEYYGTDDT